MKTSHKQLIIAAFAIVLAVTTGSSVLAQEAETDSPDTPVSSQQTRPDREQRVKQVERSLERCKQIATRLEERVAKTSEIKANHSERYERLIKRIDAVVASAQSRDYDTTSLTAAKEKVTTAIAAYELAVDAYIAQLGATSDLSCADNTATYGQAIVGSREALETVRSTSASVRTTFRQTVVPALKDYKAWLEENVTTRTTQESAE